MLYNEVRAETYLRSDISDRLTALAIARPEWTGAMIAAARSFGVDLELNERAAPTAREDRLIDVTPRPRALNGGRR